MIIAHFDKDISVAGSGERLVGDTLEVMSATIQAKSTNTDKVYIGGAGTSSSSYGVSLSAGESYSVPRSALSKDTRYTNLEDFWVDAGVDGEGVTVLYFLRDI